MEGHTSRIGEKFNKEIESIKEKRILLNIDKKKKSTKVITNKIIEHEEWKQLKEDTIRLKF